MWSLFLVLLQLARGQLIPHVSLPDTLPEDALSLLNHSSLLPVQNLSLFTFDVSPFNFAFLMLEPDSILSVSLLEKKVASASRALIRPATLNCTRLFDAESCRFRAQLEEGLESRLLAFTGLELFAGNTLRFNVAPGSSGFFGLAITNRLVSVSISPLSKATSSLTLFSFRDFPSKLWVIDDDSSASLRKVQLKSSRPRDELDFVIFQVSVPSSESTAVAFQAEAVAEYDSAYSSNENYAPFWASILAILIIVAMCFSYSICIVLLRRRATRQLAGPRIDVEMIPLRKFSSVHDSVSTEDAICPICLEEYQEEDGLRILGCEHHAHQVCMDTWLQEKPVCPLCQQHVSNAHDLRHRPKEEEGKDDQVLIPIAHEGNEA